MRFVCTLQGKLLALNSAFRSGRSFRTDLFLDRHMVAACRQTDRWEGSDLRRAKKAMVPPHFEGGV